MADEALKQVEALKKAYLRVFDSEDGKKVMQDLERRCYVHSPTISQNNDPLKMAYREGQRATYLHIQHMMRLNIKRIREMQEKKGEGNV